MLQTDRVARRCIQQLERKVLVLIVTRHSFFDVFSSNSFNFIKVVAPDSSVCEIYLWQDLIARKMCFYES